MGLGLHGGGGRMTKRRAIAAALFGLFASGCAETAKKGPGPELLYVSNEDSGTLSVIDTSALEVVATVPVGKRPRGVRVSPDGARVFVAVSGSPKCPPSVPDEECAKRVADKALDGIAVVDARTRRKVAVLPGGSDPEQFDLSPDGRRLFVSNEDAGIATVVDVPSGQVVKTVLVGEEPEGVRVSPDGSLVYVTSESDHRITVFAAATGEVVARIPVGHRPRDIAFTSAGKRAFVSAEIDGSVSVIDVASSRVTATITPPQGSRTMGVLVSPDDRRLYVSNGRARTISVVDLETLAVRGSVEVGERPWGMALAPDGKRLYTANGPSNHVAVVETETLEVRARIPVGEMPWGLAISPPPRP